MHNLTPNTVNICYTSVIGRPNVAGSVILSLNCLYRYELRRIWDDVLPPMCIGMLNPSTAGGRQDDPTVRRLYGFAVRAGCGSIIVWNIGAGRSSSPQRWRGMTDPCGPDNRFYQTRALLECRRRNGIVLVGWGNNAPMNASMRVIDLARRLDIQMLCLGRTATGAPRHPLYVRADQPLEPYP